MWKDVAEAVEACVRPVGVVEPDPAGIEPYRELVTRYRALYPAIAAVEGGAPR